MAEEKAPAPETPRPETDAAGETTTAPADPAAGTAPAGAPKLPASFFSKLVRQPRCVTEGVCDNCGRCEH
jgi:hypothetical protein